MQGPKYIVKGTVYQSAGECTVQGINQFHMTERQTNCQFLTTLLTGSQVKKSPPKNENIRAITKNKLPNSQIVLILMINTLNYYQKLFSKTSACAPFKSLHVQLSVQLTCLACNLQKKPAPQTAQNGAGKHKVT